MSHYNLSFYFNKHNTWTPLDANKQKEKKNCLQNKSS